MKFLEKDLEEIIYESHLSSVRLLSERGLPISGRIRRQCRIGNYGIADLVTVEKEYDVECDYDYVNGNIRENGDTYSMIEVVVPKLIVTVYELKKDKIGISAYLQAIKYVKGLKTYFEKRKFTNKLDFNIVLIGSSLDLSGSFSYIPSINDNVRFYTYNYDVDGIKFKSCNSYNLIETGL